MVNYIKILLLLSVCLSSCDFDDTNLDPTRPTDAELKEILPAALTQTAHNLSSIGARVTGIIVQHLDGIDAQPESYAQYLIDERSLDEFWRTGLYAGAMKDCNLIIENADQENRPHYMGIAQILMAINLGIATSFWGDVPYQEAFLGLEELQPKYDDQEEVYQSIQQLLSDAITNLNLPASNNPPFQDDLIFNGNSARWLATAKALKARYHLHLEKRDATAAQKALNAIQTGALSTLKEQADFPFGNTINEANPLALYCFERPDQLVMNDYLYNYLVESQDPRLNDLVIKLDNEPHFFRQDSLQLYWGQFDAPLPLISLTEILFIEAESHLRLDDHNQAEIKFKEAVTAHFQQLGIEPENYEFFILENIHFENSNSFEEKLKFILKQKHLSLFAQNPIEAWVDYRRTNSIDLQTPSTANPSFNPSLQIPRRYLYPISERNSNHINWEAAIQNQGGHLLDVDMWAFQ